MELIAILEGILFVVGSDGISKEELISIMNIEAEELDILINNLNEEYTSNKRGIEINILGNKLKLTTKKEHRQYYEKLTEVEIGTALSSASLETLAIIAYNEPITRVQVDEIRGINSSHIIKKLLLKNLIRDLGRSDAPGHPILYGVTPQFLDYFGLESINDLPPLEEIDELDESTNLFESKYHE